MSLVNHLELIYQAAIRAVSPYKLVYDALKFTPKVAKSIAGVLTCGERNFEVNGNVKSEHWICGNNAFRVTGHKKPFVYALH